MDTQRNALSTSAAHTSEGETRRILPSAAIAGFAITFGGGPFVSDLAENRSETVSDLSENRSETKVGDTRPGQEPKEKS